MSFLSDFKAFAMRGNVIDLAVGVVVGGAFGQIVNSLVNDIIMPPIGILVGGVDFSDLAFTLKPATADAAAVVIKYGAFIQTCVNFLIIAFSIFLFIKLLSKLERKKTEDIKVPPSKDQELLGEIRDLLKSQNKKSGADTSVRTTAQASEDSLGDSATTGSTSTVSGK